MSRYGFFFDSSACSGCKTCQVACKDKNNLGPGIRFRRVYEVCGSSWQSTNEGAWVPNIAAYNLSVACNHCENPSCVTACPTRAMSVDSQGIVSVNPDRCVGCRYCEWACPYGAPQYNYDSGIMQKCDFCKDYIDQGMKPVCVSSCLMRALDFDTLENLEVRYGKNRDVHPLPSSAHTGPSLIIEPHPTSGLGASINAAIINREEVKNER